MNQQKKWTNIYVIILQKVIVINQHIHHLSINDMMILIFHTVQYSYLFTKLRVWHENLFLWCFLKSEMCEKNPQFNFSSQNLISKEHISFKWGEKTPRYDFYFPIEFEKMPSNKSFFWILLQNMQYKLDCKQKNPSFDKGFFFKYMHRQ